VVAETTPRAYGHPQPALGGGSATPRGKKKKKKNLSKLLTSALLPLPKNQRPHFLHQSFLPLCTSLSLHFNPNTNPYVHGDNYSSISQAITLQNSTTQSRRTHFTTPFQISISKTQPLKSKSKQQNQIEMKTYAYI
jgi:hypothetical protein